MSAKLVYQKSGLFRNLGEKLRERAQTQSVREQTKGDLIGVATNKTKPQTKKLSISFFMPRLSCARN